MSRNHEILFSANARRQVLVVDDEEINRDLLTVALEQDYEVLTAANGQEALKVIRKNRVTLSLILLDLLMPGMHGLELLRMLKDDPDYRHIPVIVVTADSEAEVASLQMGAVDFIPKPYPRREVIQARAKRTIELFENRDTIHFTERDPLTGLYNREYFYLYAQQFDQFHPDTPMDAIVVDVYHFHMINERYGKLYGDDVLRRIGERVREMVKDAGGLVCRRAADTFLIYCPHREDYARILDRISLGLAGRETGENRIRLRMGVYANVDRSIEMERRFDRAKIAADTVRKDYVNSVALYDMELHQSEIYHEQLLEDFDQALAQGQFQVYFQPKFDIRPDVPVLASAEALVRWDHPQLGRINPSVFIPLFEENGLIGPLDHYVWQEAAAKLRDWKDRLGVSVPVSVNVSRVDMFDPRLVDIFKALLEDYGLQASDILLEITESAYTQNAAQIISTVNQMRSLGFRVEMDDFGSGYSSLNMISSLPIDALKLDMGFIHDAFQAGRNPRLLEVIIDIAEYLSVPVIAEGVETWEQLRGLKNMGCDTVQGYYFSPPCTAKDFEHFLLAKKAGDVDGPAAAMRGRGPARFVPAKVAQALAVDYMSIFHVDMQDGSFVVYGAQDQRGALQLDVECGDFFTAIRKSIKRTVHPMDQQMLLRALSRESLEKELESMGVFTLTFRLLADEKPTLVSLKAVYVDDGARHVVIGVRSVEAQTKREEELGAARDSANRDPLTGVKSKFAFEEAQARLDGEIASGGCEPFALAVCAVNMHEGTIIDAARRICENFKHSPVYRLDGEKFAVLMQGRDYENREELIESMRAAKKDGGPRIACGTADYRPGADLSLNGVFHRADAAMYRNRNE